MFEIVKTIYDGAYVWCRYPVASVRTFPDITELSRTSSSASTEVVLEYWSWRAAILDRDVVTSKVVPVIPLEETSAILLRTSVSVLDSKDRLHCFVRISRNQKRDVRRSCSDSTTLLLHYHDRLIWSIVLFAYESALTTSRRILTTYESEWCPMKRHKSKVVMNGWLLWSGTVVHILRSGTGKIYL